MCVASNGILSRGQYILGGGGIFALGNIDPGVIFSWRSVFPLTPVHYCATTCSATAEALIPGGTESFVAAKVKEGKGSETDVNSHDLLYYKLYVVLKPSLFWPSKLRALVL